MSIYFLKSKSNFKKFVNSSKNIIDKEILILKNESKYNINNINNNIEDLRNDLDKIKNIIQKDINIEDLRNDLNKIKNIIQMNIDFNIEDLRNDLNKIKNIIQMDFNFNFKSFDYYYKFKYLTNEGIKKNFNKKIKNYKLLYKASTDGYGSEDFHAKCDGKSNTITLILTKNNKLFGGFTDKAWDKRNEYKSGNKGFIFSINNNKIYYNKDNNYNIYCSKKDGPIFGEYDIKISNKCNENNDSYDNTDSYTSAYDIQGEEYVLAGTQYFSVIDYAVYQLELE